MVRLNAEIKAQAGDKNWKVVGSLSVMHTVRNKTFCMCGLMVALDAVSQRTACYRLVADQVP